MGDLEFYGDFMEDLLREKKSKLDIILSFYMQNIEKIKNRKNYLKEFAFNYEYLCMLESLMGFFSEEKKEERFIRASLKLKNGINYDDIAKNVFFIENKKILDILEERLKELQSGKDEQLKSSELSRFKIVLEDRVKTIFSKQDELQKEFNDWKKINSSLEQYKFSEDNIKNHFDKVIGKLLNQNHFNKSKELDISNIKKFQKRNNRQKTVRLNSSLYKEWLKKMQSVPGLEKETQANLFNISMTWAIEKISEFEKNKIRQEALNTSNIKQSSILPKE